MNAITAITAACLALGAASIAASARAADFSTCEMAGNVAGLAMMQRATGASQHEAAATAGSIISQVANSSSAPYGLRVAIADRLADMSTMLIWLVYSGPLNPELSPAMNAAITEEVVFDLCLEGRI